MNNNILSTGGRAFHKFISQLTSQLTRPKAKFITDLLCGMLFSSDLILTNIASKVPQPSRLTAIAKRFRRQLADSQSFLKVVLFNYLRLARRRLDVDSLFIVDLSDIAKPYAKKMENIATVRDGDKGCLVTGYWCMEVYCRDKDGIIWPLMLWPYSLEAEGQLSENAQILSILSQLDEHFGEGFGIWVFDRGFDRLNLIEPFLASKRHFIIRQRGDRMVVLDNGVHITLRDLVEHLFAQSRSRLVYKKVYLPDIDKPLYVVAYQRQGYERPIILLTDMVVENRDLALGVRNRYAKRWVGCETSVQFLKSRIGLERFAVRKYQSMQGLILLASLAMGFLSFLQSRCKDIRQRIEDKLRYCREPKSFWFYRLVIALRDSLSNRAKMSLSTWCRPP
ncbi:hypothetical protein ES703_113852 [subsurface metagenome]